MADVMDEGIKNIHRGIARAQRDYEAWTGGDWLWHGPEYMLTTYIAKDVSRAMKLQTFYIVPERNVRVSVDEAGGVGRGKVSDRLRLNVKLTSWCCGPMAALVQLLKSRTK